MKAIEIDVIEKRRQITSGISRGVCCRARVIVLYQEEDRVSPPERKRR